MDTQRTTYRGKRFEIPQFSSHGGFVFIPERAALGGLDSHSLVLRDLNRPFDPTLFLEPRLPLRLGTLSDHERATFSQPGSVRTLDMPIKFAGNPEFRVPRELAQFLPTLRRIASTEVALNPDRWIDYFAYLTIDQQWVEAGELEREAPCHVDGFQGDRWQPKMEGNHTYTVSDCLPTWFYPYPFDLSTLNLSEHDVYWAFNYWVAQRNSVGRWQSQPFELTLMDCYCVHRGMEAPERVFRTWLRLSFETRVFDRLGNAHNPLFDYDWKMVPRDIEELRLRAYHADCDPSLRVFPWQDLDGSPLPPGAPKTRPNLTPLGPHLIND